ncbi:homoserine O-acetyltransferase [Ilumatobacter fluminis]|uniref:Homoserine O-acetyltransferase n=1 Tax=Ilumatobacter fluminis TaxID=467091 RepID=A0A4V3EJ19_9ACTN|nr:homoserine O-acetyltransferase [Ilumatobacter fluminis]TDT16608.1 homoserine O-acetyltransferase [Ilumatobacter fluminis]
MSTTPPPVSGAWSTDDPVGDRRFHTFATEHPFAVENGSVLRDVTVAYETWGELNDDASNAILVCHAWTGDSHAAGRSKPGHPAPGWWDDVIGPGKYIDTDRWFVVCPNVLGGCQGSTGPASPHPDDGRPYGSRFPVVTIRDMVRAQWHLMRHLGIDQWASVVGGSMGGMQVLEWAIMYPSRVRSLVPIASCMEASAQQIAWGVIGRRAIRLDPRWRGGDYYDAEPGDGPTEGLAIARQVAQVTFRSDNAFTQRFGRSLTDRAKIGDTFGLWQEFEVERYLQYHGDKLVNRFDANSYLIIGKAMDLHDVGRGRGGVERAMRRITVPNLTIGIDSDVLYPEYQQREMCSMLSLNGVANEYVQIESTHGHDAFLIHFDRVGEPIAKFLDQVDRNG